MIKIKKEIITSLIEQAKKSAPIEACGYLAAKNKIICKLYALTNLDQTDDHFTMDPKEQFAAVKDIRNRNMELKAVYHSHPATPARPSVEDIRLAYDPKISYVIVSLVEQDSPVKSFRIEQGKVTAEPITVVS